MEKFRASINFILVWPMSFFFDRVQARNKRYRAVERLLWSFERISLPEIDKYWWNDREFWLDYLRFEPKNQRSAERKLSLVQLLGSLTHVDGATAECGTYQGASSYFMCKARGNRSVHYVFDSFEGLSEPGDLDRSKNTLVQWQVGDLSTNEEQVRRELAQFSNVQILLRLDPYAIF